MLTSLLRGLAIMYATIKASTTLHNQVFKKMIKSAVTFFETTPIGRIQNIFSRDIDEGKTKIFLELVNKCISLFIFLL